MCARADLSRDLKLDSACYYERTGFEVAGSGTGGLKEHGIYYFVPSLLKHFQTAQINELIVPRAHLSVNGRRDPLTPPAGVEKIRDYLLPLYRQHGKEEDCRIELFDCARQELPEMRKVIVEWMEGRLGTHG